MPTYVNIRSQYVTIPVDCKSYNIPPRGQLETLQFLDHFPDLKRISDEPIHNPIGERLFINNTSGTYQEITIDQRTTRYIKLSCYGSVDVYINKISNIPPIRLSTGRTLDLHAYNKIEKIILYFISTSCVTLYTLTKHENTIMPLSFYYSGDIGQCQSTDPNYYYDPQIPALISIDTQRYDFFIGSKNITGNKRWMNAFENIPGSKSSFTLQSQNIKLDYITYNSEIIEGTITFNIYNGNNIIYTFTTSNQSGKIITNLPIQNVSELRVDITTPTTSDNISYPSLNLFIKNMILQP